MTTGGANYSALEVVSLGPLILAVIFIMWIAFVSVFLEKKNFSLRNESTATEWESNKIGFGIGAAVAALSTFAYVKFGNN